MDLEDINFMSLYTKLHDFNRKALVQAFVLGVLSFAQPGIWTALLITGAGGLQTVHTANTANVIVFVVMTATSPFAAVLINIIGIRWAILIGSIGFPFYSAGLYKNSLDGTQWFVLFGSALTGLTGEGTAAVYYPSDERSLYVGIWQFVNKFGLVIAGAISLSLNINTSESGSVSLNTYIAFISINCIGILLVWFMVKPEEVLRRDGLVAKSNLTNETLKQRFSKIWYIYRKKEVLLLAPVAMASMWFNTWQSNYITNYFSVRSRALNTLTTAFVQMAADLGVGFLLDSKLVLQRTKLRWSWHIINIAMVAFFIYAFIIQAIYDRNPPLGLDWSDTGFSRGFVPYLLFKFFQEALLNWIYWVVGSMNFHATEITYVVSVVRGYETFGEMWAFVVGVTNSSDMVNLAVSAAIYFSVIPFVTYLIHYVVEDVGLRNTKHNSELDDEDYGPSVSSLEKEKSTITVKIE